jgi:thioredoxin 1
MKKRFLFSALAALFFASMSARADELFVDSDYASAQAQAKAKEKMVMIDFKAEWCGPCKVLDRTTWKDEKVIESVKEKAIAIKIDVDQHRDLAAHFAIRSIPTIIFLDSDGNEVKRFIGYRDADRFLEEFESVGEG